MRISTKLSRNLSSDLRIFKSYQLFLRMRAVIDNLFAENNRNLIILSVLMRIFKTILFLCKNQLLEALFKRTSQNRF